MMMNINGSRLGDVSGRVGWLDGINENISFSLAGKDAQVRNKRSRKIKRQLANRDIQNAHYNRGACLYVCCLSCHVIAAFSESPVFQQK